MPTQSTSLSIIIMPLENRREAILELAMNAEKQGFGAILLPETWAFDTTVLLSEIAVRTKTLRIGTGVLSVWGRSAGTIAMAASTLSAVSGGRFILGLGSSTKQLAEGLHDVIYQAPYEKLRQTITQVRTLIRGERVPLQAGTGARSLKLNLPEFYDIPILLAASSKKSIRIAGELCDGWLPFLFPRDHLQDGIALLQENARLAGRSDPDLLIYPIIPTIVAEDTTKAREGAAWVVNFYMSRMGPIYRNVLKRYGYRAEVERILEVNKGGKTSIVPPEEEVLLEQLTIYGTPEEVREKLPAWYEAGATLPCPMLNPNLSLEAIRYSVESIQPSK